MWESLKAFDRNIHRDEMWRIHKLQQEHVYSIWPHPLMFTTFQHCYVCEFCFTNTTLEPYSQFNCMTLSVSSVSMLILMYNALLTVVMGSQIHFCELVLIGEPVHKFFIQHYIWQLSLVCVYSYPLKPYAGILIYDNNKGVHYIH